MPTFTNYTFAQLEQMILERDSMICDRDEQIEKLESKIQKKRQIIVDLKKRIVDKPLVEALFDEETESQSSDSKPEFTNEQLTNTISFFEENYQWLPEQLLQPGKRCHTSIRDIYEEIKDWGRCLGIPVQGDDRQILSRIQLIQYLRDEHKSRYQHLLKWNVSKFEDDSENYPNGSRNIPYFHCLRK